MPKAMVLLDVPEAIMSPVALGLPPGLSREQWTIAGSTLARRCLTGSPANMPPELRVLHAIRALCLQLENDSTEARVRSERVLGGLLRLPPGMTVLPEENIEEMEVLDRMLLDSWRRRLEQATSFLESFPSADWAVVSDETRALLERLIDVLARQPPFLEAEGLADAGHEEGDINEQTDARRAGAPPQ